MAGRTAEENSIQGTRDWILDNVATSREIEGFCVPSSIPAGGAVSVRVSTHAPRFRAEVFRLGYYDGDGARLVASLGPFDGSVQLDPPPDIRGASSCIWPESFEIQLNDPVPGCYLVKLVAMGGTSDGLQRYVSFVVRDAQDTAVDFVVHRADATDAAYNFMISSSLYVTTAPRTNAVSFDRPLAWGWGAGLLLQFEFQNIWWLERQGYELNYITSADLHRSIDPFLRCSGFLSIGHDEYWSYEMRANVEAARDGGLCLGFLGANACYWQVRFEPTIYGPDRMMVCYKDAWLLGDDAEVAPASTRRTTTWRDSTLRRPEQNLCGVMFSNWGSQQPFVAINTDSWPYTGSHASESDAFQDVMGYEVDRVFQAGDTFAERVEGTTFGKTYMINDLEPGPDPLVLGRSPYQGELDSLFPADTVLSTRPYGAKVFAAGTVAWGSALMDPGLDWAAPTAGPGWQPANPITGLGHRPLQVTTHNILANFRAGPLGVFSVSPGDSQATITLRWTDRSPVSIWPVGRRHAAVGKFLAASEDEQLALLRTEELPGPQMCILSVSPLGTVEPDIWINRNDSGLLNGWHDEGDVVVAGDFLGAGHDQLLFINNDGMPPNTGRVLVVDFSGSDPVVGYRQEYGDSELLNGWQLAEYALPWRTAGRTAASLLLMPF